jgi:hypothetical protein
MVLDGSDVKRLSFVDLLSGVMLGDDKGWWGVMVVM